MTSQYFIGDMMPELANPVQQSLTVIEIRPFKGAGSVTRVPVSNRTGLATRPRMTQSATPLRARFGRSEIRVLNNDNSIERVISFEKTAQL